MNVRHFLCALALAAIPALGAAQAHLPDLKDKLKIHKERLPRPSHKLYTVHPRRLAVAQKGGRRQVRFLSHKQNHVVRKDIRGVTHHLATPHRPAKTTGHKKH